MPQGRKVLKLHMWVMCSLTSSNEKYVVLQHVLHVPHISTNLLSVYRITKHSYGFYFDSSILGVIDKNSLQIIASATQEVPLEVPTTPWKNPNIIFFKYLRLAYHGGKRQHAWFPHFVLSMRHHSPIIYTQYSSTW